MYTIGDGVKENDVAIWLVSCKGNNGTEYFRPADGCKFLYFTFYIENNSDKVVSISSMLDVDAYVDDYEVSESFTADCANNADSFDGTLYPGKKLQGVLCYEVPSDYEHMQIILHPGFWDYDSICWGVKNGN